MKHDLYIEIDNIFNTKLDMECYANFKEVYFDLLYNKLGVLKTKLLHNIKFNSTALYNDMQKRLSFDSDLENIPFIAKLNLIQTKVISQPICHCGNLIKYSNSRNGLYNCGCSLGCRNKISLSKAKVIYFEKTGYKNPWSNPDVVNSMKRECSALTIQKRKDTYFKKTGYISPSADPQIKHNNLVSYYNTIIDRLWENIIKNNKHIPQFSKQYFLDTLGKEKYLWKCVNCNNMFHEYYNSQRPITCQDCNKHNASTMLKKLNNIDHCTPLFSVEEYIGGGYDIEYPWRCNTCNEQFRSYYYNIVKQCPRCSKQNAVSKIWDTICNLSYCTPVFSQDEYIDSTREYDWQCKYCNHIYSSVYRSQPKMCPLCTRSRSKGEIELYNYIQSLIPDVEVIANDYSVIHPKELDIYIPSLKLAFEYNGDYWHGLKEIGYHEGKTNGCLSKGITLYHIWESAWTQTQDETKELISKIIKNFSSSVINK